MSRKIFLIIGLLLVLAAIPLTVFLVFQKQLLTKKAAPATVLSLAPATITKNVGETFTVNINVDSGTNQIVSADIDLSFNPTVLEVSSITKGTFFPDAQEPTKIIDNNTGKIKYSLFSMVEKQGAGAFASIVFKGKGGGLSALAFDPTTTIGGRNETEALSRAVPGNYVITAAAPPTGGSTPTSAVILTLTPTPAGRGGLVATSTPTPTPTTTLRTTPTPTSASALGGGTLPTPTPTLPITLTLTPTPTIPVTGNFETTVMLLMTGLLLLMFGAGTVFLVR